VGEAAAAPPPSAGPMRGRRGGTTTISQPAARGEPKLLAPPMSRSRHRLGRARAARQRQRAQAAAGREQAAQQRPPLGGHGRIAAPGRRYFLMPHPNTHLTNMWFAG
jgi:hypothetical protein